LVYPSGRDLAFPRYANLNAAAVCQIDHVRLQLHFLFIGQVAVLNAQMGLAEFRADDPSCRLGHGIKTIIAKPVSEHFFLKTAIQTLIAQKINGNLLVQKLVYVQKIGFENQIILNGRAVFSLHFGEYSFVIHLFKIICGVNLRACFLKNFGSKKGKTVIRKSLFL
jgi:hypothetical protein